MEITDGPHRVRSLIRFLNYGQLRKDKVLPKEALFTKVPRGGKFPKMATEMGYSDFGLFMEHIVREAVLCHGEGLLSVFERCREYVPREYQKLYNPKDYLEIGESLRDHFSSEKDIPIFEPEWESIADNIVGHPDVVTEDCVYDIKTTGKFGSMRTHVLIPQILCYYALAHINGYENTTSVGTILPAQRLILTMHLKGWDWKPFWEKVIGCISLKSEHGLRNSLPVSQYLEFQKMLKTVGNHVEKSCLKEAIAYGFPTQFFVAGRISTKITSLSKGLSLFLKNRFEQPIFIHSPYTINLSNPHGKFKKADEELELPWGLDVLVKILKTGEDANLNGVVVHCGKRGALSQEEALKGMYDSLCLVAPYISEDAVCPLLLETSSGQNGELLYDPEAFSEFYLSLPEEVRCKIKICTDTCHIFAAGYDPMEFVETLESKGIPIALVHYNDSKVPKGSKKDRHARIGEGYIGAEALFKFLLWANKNRIPCVHE